MSDNLVNSKFVIVNDSGTADSIVSRYYGKARVETNHIFEQQTDPKDFPPASVQDIPSLGEPCIAMDIYNHLGIVYTCIQDHNRTVDEPIDIPALFRIYRAQGLEWVQPIDQYDAYNIGDWCTFEGSPYTSLIDANVWSPTGYPAGWELIEEI